MATPSRRLGFVLNPVSGAGKGLEQWRKHLKPLLEEECGAEGTAWLVRETAARGDATHLTRKLVEEEGVTVVISVGGDGTHNEVVNGYLSCSAKSKGVALGIISVGTGGDLRRTVYASLHESGAVEQLRVILEGRVVLVDAGLCTSTPHKHAVLDICNEQDEGEEKESKKEDDGASTSASAPASTRTINAEGTVSEEDCGEVDEEVKVLAEGDAGEGERLRRYFLNISSLGIGGTICHKVNTSSKAMGGFVSFFYQTCLQTLLWRNKPIRVWLDHSDESFEVKVYNLVMAIGKYHGGGVFVAPEATMCSGAFEVIRFRDIGVVDFSVLARVYFGSHTKHAKVDGLRARHVRAEAVQDENLLIEIDGEEGGMLPAEWEILPAAVLMVVPEHFNQAADGHAASSSSASSSAPSATSAAASSGPFSSRGYSPQDSPDTPEGEPGRTDSNGNDSTPSK
eukprot:TRINITY_DN5075_c0_g1_i1.p1 TRINITY_DN5075_c0_g1~~TRINITY_DN5075_c0_g1_i1.p1  ORF type:complete len:485 (-),score=156.65 TRINITY_DN5075_c0_g1_i1:627-1988(-)